jgi:hypothetical protein
MPPQSSQDDPEWDETDILLAALFRAAEEAAPTPEAVRRQMEERFETWLKEHAQPPASGTVLAVRPAR